jgi:4-diphosphocytidyl-2-C-methyl-D-erythritol kinase
MKIEAPAKINLYLEVVRRRDDGYHELRTLMCGVGLYDTLTLAIGGPQNEIVCLHPDLPCDASNLALKAALHFNAALTSETKIVPEKVSIHLTKRIPVGAGLGGGSSDAAAVLTQLNRHYRHPFDPRQLNRMALALGADVPFFMEQRPALATGVGEQLTPYEFLAPLGVVLVYPGICIATADVFENLNLALTKCKKKLRYSPFNREKFDATRHLCNDLEAGVDERFPVVGHIKKKLLNQGAIGALMSGSGSTVFGLFADGAAACKAADGLDREPAWQVYATELLC